MMKSIEVKKELFDNKYTRIVFVLALSRYIDNQPRNWIPYDKGVGKGRCLSWTLDCANNIFVNFDYISPDKMEVHISGRYEMNVSTVENLYSVAQGIISLMEVNQSSDD